MNEGWYALVAAILAIAAHDYTAGRPDTAAHRSAAAFLTAAGVAERAHLIIKRGAAVSHSPASAGAERCI